MNFRRTISCVVIGIMLLAMLMIPAIPTATAASFTDVPDGYAEAEDIETAVSLGLMKSESPNCFGFGKLMTRAEFVQSLCQFFGWELMNPVQGSYLDNQDTETWYYRVVETAYAHGAITNQTEKFYPEAPISREAIAVMLIRAMGFGTLAGRAQEFLIPFQDVESNAGYIAMAYEMGLMNGTSETTFSPEETVTREQAAVILTGLYQKCCRTVTNRIGILSTDQIDNLDGYEAVGIAARKLIVSENGIRLVGSIREETIMAIREKTRESGAKALLYVTGPTGSVLGSDLVSTAELLVSEVENGGYDGLFLDLPTVKWNQSNAYLELAKILQTALDGKLLYLMTEAPSWDGVTYNGYDFEALEDYVDRLVLRVTSYEQINADGFPVAPMQPLEEVYYAFLNLTKWTKNSEKLSLFLTTTAPSWKGERYQGTLSAADVQELRKDASIKEYYSARYGCAYLMENSERDAQVAWYLNGSALEQRIWLAGSFGVDQICFSDLSSIASYDGYTLLDDSDG